MADTGFTFDSAMAEAKHRGVGIIAGDKPGSIRFKWPTDANGKPEVDPEFKARVLANRAVMTTGFTTPKTLKDNVQDAAGSSWLEGINGYLNKVRDRYVAPVGGAIGQFLGSGGSPDPNEGGLGATGRAVGESAIKGLVPDSITGKAVNLSLAAQPESFLARMAIPTAVGAGTGALTGEGAGQGALQGGVAAVAGEIPGLGGQAKGAKNVLQRAERTKINYDDVVPGEKLSGIFRLKSFDELRNRYGNWVRALKDVRVGREAGQRLSDGMDDLQQSVKQYAVKKAEGIRQDFTNKQNVPFKLRKDGYTDELYKQNQAVRKEATKALTEGRQIIGAMRKTKALGAKVYGPGGKLRSGPAVPETMELLNTTKQAIKERLPPVYPNWRGG